MAPILLLLLGEGAGEEVEVEEDEEGIEGEEEDDEGGTVKEDGSADLICERTVKVVVMKSAFL